MRFLFVNFDSDCAPLTDYLGDMPENCAAYAPENMVCTRRKTYPVVGNWKLYFENYNDSLHIPFGIRALWRARRSRDARAPVSEWVA